MFLKQADFTGQFNLSQSADITDDLNVIIEQTERDILTSFFGQDLYLKFVTDYNGTTFANEYYKKIYDGGIYEVDELNRTFNGLKKTLICFCFAEYKQQTTLDTSVGTVITDKDNSIIVDMMSLKKLINKAYNLGVLYYNEAYAYALANLTEFATIRHLFLQPQSEFTVL